MRIITIIIFDLGLIAQSSVSAHSLGENKIKSIDYHRGESCQSNIVVWAITKKFKSKIQLGTAVSYSGAHAPIKKALQQQEKQERLL